MNDRIPEITPTELQQRLERGDRLTLIDVRKPMEWQIGNLEEHGARLIPLDELPDRYEEISPEDEVVLICRSGRRSTDALEFLQQRGYDRLWNLDGGLLAWSDEVDPSMPKY